MTLTDEHINYIIKDIAYRGIVDDDLGEEVVDHICTNVEQNMQKGMRFIEAYDQAISRFGSETRLQQLQSQTISYSNNNFKIMVKNYFKIAFRSLLKHKFYSVINVTGLAVSMACCLLISLFVIDELSYDTFFKDSEDIYRSNRFGKYGDNEFNFAVAPAPFGPALEKEIPEVEYVTRFRSRGTYLVRTEDMTAAIKESSLVFADASFFKLFGVSVLKGNGDKALKKPMTIAISESMANKYFKDKNALNQVLILDGDEEYQVTAVYKDLPKNSHFYFDFIMSMEDIERSRSTQWTSNNFYTYFKVKKGVNINELEKKINNMADAYVGPQIEQFSGHSFEEFKGAGNYMYFTLQPLTDIYLNSDFTFDIGKTGDITYVYLFMIIAVFILVIACINFMNLSTARSANRAKEVGVRKVLGSYKSHLVRQFLTESIILSLVSFIISIVIVTVTLPIFNEIAGKSLVLPFDQVKFYLIFFGGAIFIGFLAGVYPAFFLSSFKPVNVLKGKLSLGSKSGLVRSGLVVFQFLISIVLLIGTAAIYKQMDYIQNKKIGFDKEQVMLINDSYMLGDKLQSFKDELLQLSDVRSATSSGFLPVNGYSRSDNTFWPEGKEPTEDNLVSMQVWPVDYDYLKTMGLELVNGRNFNKDLASDSSAILLNETAFAAYNLSENKDNWIQTNDFDPKTNTMIPDQYIKYHVVGVVKDFHFESMKLPIGSLGMRIGRSTSVTSVKFNSTNYANSISAVKNIWEKFAPSLPFNYTFLDNAFGKMYQSEQRLSRVFTIFACLAIFIGCLGLFALAAFMAEQRTKEIGIRKVMGASVRGIVLMLSKEFSKLVIIAFVLAVPLAWWGVNLWLGEYTYKIEMGIEIYMLAGLLSFLVAWLTVSYQSIKAAQSNPVDSLRSE